MSAELARQEEQRKEDIARRYGLWIENLRATGLLETEEIEEFRNQGFGVEINDKETKMMIYSEEEDYITGFRGVKVPTYNQTGIVIEGTDRGVDIIPFQRRVHRPTRTGFHGRRIAPDDKIESLTRGLEGYDNLAGAINQGLSLAQYKYFMWSTYGRGSRGRMDWENDQS